MVHHGFQSVGLTLDFWGRIEQDSVFMNKKIWDMDKDPGLLSKTPLSKQLWSLILGIMHSKQPSCNLQTICLSKMSV
jgi:hypothetical protein